MKQLRPYQAAAIKAMWNWVYNEQGFQFVAAAVNAGKSLIIAEFIRQAHARWPHIKTIMLIDEQELLRQNMDELREQWPEVDAGFYSAGIGQKRLHNDVVVAGIQSIHSKAHLLNKAPNLIIVDEGHGVSQNKDTQFRRFIDDCIKLNPKLQVIGLSGSKYRSDTGLVYGSKDSLFSGMSFEISVKYMIEQGYSVRPVVPYADLVVDTSGARIRKNEYVDGDLQNIFDHAEITRQCVDQIIRVGEAQNRHQWLVYTTGVEHCENVYNEFLRRGINACRTHSKIEGESSEILAAYKANKHKVLIVVGQAVKGFSHNGVELIAYMTKTRSVVKYEQTVGRGMRTNYAPDMPLDTQEQRLAAIAASRKPDFVLLDFGGVVAELGPIDAIIPPVSKAKRKPKDDEEESKPVEPKLKFCPECESPAAQAQAHCYECGHEFIAMPLISTQADTQSAVLSSDIQPERLQVLDMTLSKHTRKRKNDEPEDKEILPVLKVAYATYGGTIYEWVCFNHTGTARKNACEWHDRHMPDYKGMFPKNVDDALFYHKENRVRYATPTHIWAIKKGKYWEFIRAEFEKKEDDKQFKKELDDLLDHVGFL